MKRFKPGDICIVLDGFYKNIEVEVISYFSSSKVHVKRKDGVYAYTFFIPENLLELEIIVNSPLYKALS